MVQTLEAIRGGGGSIKVGTVGTISSLMTRELESSISSTSHAPSSSKQTQVPESHVNRPTYDQKKSDDQASSSEMRASIVNKHRSPEATRKSARGKGMINGKNLDFADKSRSHKRSSNNTPRLRSKDTPLEKTPLREKPRRKGSNIVDVVDLHCGNPAGSLSNRLKKLGLSRMSQSFM